MKWDAEYRKKQKASWTPKRRVAASSKMKGRKITWAKKISASIVKKYEDPEYLAKKERHKTPPALKEFRHRLKNYRNNAKHKGLTWGLTDTEAVSLFVAPCHYCGFAAASPKANGIDRKNNCDGYVPENVVPCCKVCNWAKGKMTYGEFIVWLNHVADFRLLLKAGIK